MIINPAARELIAKIIADRIHAELADQQDLGLQEPNISAGVAAELRKWEGTIVDGWEVTCVARELEDRGAGSAEDVSGADIYVAVTIKGPKDERISKGFLVQAKMGSKPSRSRDLVEQCRKMKKKTDDAYVWIYRERDIIVVKANDVLNRKPFSREFWPSRSPEDALDRILKCKEGDRDFGIPAGLSPHEGLKRRLGELRMMSGVAFDIGAHE